MNEVPSHYRWFRDSFPGVAEGYDALGTGVHQAGPLDARTRALLKVVISGAARLEGGLHAHVRKALGTGLSSEEIYHALLLLIPTIGFPGAMAALAWAREVIEESRE